MRTALLTFVLSSATASSFAIAQTEPAPPTQSEQGATAPEPTSPRNAAPETAPPPEQPPANSAVAPVAPPPVPPPRAYFAPPPPPPEAPAPGVHEHDGFYLSVALGMSFVTDSVHSKRFDAASLLGFGLADQLAIGGTPARGWVLGAAIEDDGAFAPSLTIDGHKTSGGPNSFGLSLIGPFVDYYFEPSQGFHMQALAGLSLLTADTSQDLPIGFGGSLGLGYEWWVGSQSSLGILGRFAYGQLTYDPGVLDERHSVLASSILARYTYH
jgi:hypothetical protein